MKRLTITSAILVGCLVMGAVAMAVSPAPRLVNYQGLLTDRDTGTPLEGTHDLFFAIYADSLPGITFPLWTETHVNVPVTEGLFNVILGSHMAGGGLPLTLFNSRDRFLAITVDGDEEIAPRMRITSVPWALRAAVADSAITSGSGGSADGDWTLNGDDMYATVSGSVGIGTSSPNGKAEITSGSTSAVFSNHFFEGGTLTDFWSAVQGGYGTSARGFTGLRCLQLGNNSYYGTYGVATGTSRAYGAWGKNDTSNNYGYLGGYNYGAHGLHSATGNYGYLGTEDHGVIGVNKISGTGENPGVYGKNDITGNYAYLGGDALGAYALHAGTLNNVQLAGSGYALRAQALSGDAAQFYGDVHVLSGRLSTVEIEITGGADLSEHFDVGGGSAGTDPEPGYVVSIDPERPGQLAVSREAYDRKVAGIISGAGGIAPGLLMGQQGSVAHGRDPVALSGRVYCWADASLAPIAPGDLLTTSAVPGHAMKATDHDRAQGAIIGKAMTSLAKGRGLILVLVLPQ